MLTFLLSALLPPASAASLDAEAVASRALVSVPSLLTAETQTATRRRAARLGVVDFVPRIELSASYTRLSEVEQPPFVFAGQELESPFPQVLDQTALRATATLPVSHLFLTTLPSYKAAQSSAEVASFQEQAERQGVALQARLTYYGHLRARAAATVTQDAVTLLEAFEDDLQALLDAGQVTRADLLQTQAQLSDARVQQANADGAIKTTAVQLERMLDLDPGTLDVVVDLEPPPAVEGDLLAIALDSRPDVQLLDALIETQRHARRAQLGARLPSLAVQATSDYANPNQRQITSTGGYAGSWAVSTVLSWSPTAAIGQRRDVDRANLELMRAEQDKLTLEDQIAGDVAQAANDYEVALKTIEAAQEGLEAAREGFRVRRDLLTAGESTNNDVLDAESALRRATLAVRDAEIGAHMAHARIQHVLGRALPTSRY